MHRWVRTGAVLLPLADALDGESPYAAVLVRPGISATSSGQLTPAQAGAACDQALPEPTTAVGTAVADDDGPLIVLAFAHGSAAAAEANADAVQRIAESGTSLRSGRLWSEIVHLAGVSVADDDTTVVARLRPQDPANTRLGYDLVANRDSLVASCG